jgi:hypothetical protein
MSDSHCLQRVTRSEDPLTTNPKINLHIPRTGTCIVHAVAGLYAVPRDPLCAYTRALSSTNTVSRKHALPARRHQICTEIPTANVVYGLDCCAAIIQRRNSTCENFHRLAPRERFAESMHQTNVFRNSTYVAEQSRSTSNCTVWPDWFVRS